MSKSIPRKVRRGQSAALEERGFSLEKPRLDAIAGKGEVFLPILVRYDRVGVFGRSLSLSLLVVLVLGNPSRESSSVS
jgi:hypothetical protein